MRQHRAGEDQRAHVDKADGFEDQRQNGERQPGVRVVEVDKLHEERHVKQNSFRVGQAQRQRLAQNAVAALNLLLLRLRLLHEGGVEDFAPRNSR